MIRQLVTIQVDYSLSYILVEVNTRASHRVSQLYQRTSVTFPCYIYCSLHSTGVIVPNSYVQVVIVRPPVPPNSMALPSYSPQPLFGPDLAALQIIQQLLQVLRLFLEIG